MSSHSLKTRHQFTPNSYREKDVPPPLLLPASTLHCASKLTQETEKQPGKEKSYFLTRSPVYSAVAQRRAEVGKLDGMRFPGWQQQHPAPSTPPAEATGCLLSTLVFPPSLPTPGAAPTKQEVPHSFFHCSNSQLSQRGKYQGLI